MHLIIGALVSYIFGSSFMNKNQKKIVSFANIIELKHYLPGRIRLYVPKLKNPDFDLKDLQKQLKPIKGILSVKINQLTGNFLIHFNPQDLDSVLIVPILIRLIGLEADIEKIPVAGLGKTIQSIKKTLNRAIYDFSNGLVDLPTLSSTALLLIAGYQYLKNRTLGTPGAFVLLFWALNGLPKQEKK